MKKIILLFLLIFSNSFAQSNEELFANANNLYKNGKHLEAIKLYEEVSTNNLVSSELYFNLGNCYYKLNKVAPAIYNYEKALKLNPTNEDALNNLIFAKRLTLDRIETLPKTFLQQINLNYISKLTITNWAITCILLSLSAAVFFLLYYYSFSSLKKKLFFVSTILSFTLLITSLAISFHQYTKKTNTIEAIIYATKASVKNEPTKNGDETFIIHEGTKVTVLDSVDDWTKIKLQDGKTGWLKNHEINLLDIF